MNILYLLGPNWIWHIGKDNIFHWELIISIPKVFQLCTCEIHFLLWLFFLLRKRHKKSKKKKCHMHNNFVYDYVFFFPFFKLRSVWQIEPFWNTHQWVYWWVSQHLNIIGYYRYMIFKNTFFLWLNVAYCLFWGATNIFAVKEPDFFSLPLSIHF